MTKVASLVSTATLLVFSGDMAPWKAHDYSTESSKK